MKRNRALFKASRLYPQAREGSKLLLEALSTNRAFETVLRDLWQCDALELNSVSSCEEASSILWKHLERLSLKLLPEWALPVLMESTVHFYAWKSAEMKEAQFFPWIGPALKISLASIWPQVWTSNISSISRAVSDLATVVRVAGTINQIEALQAAFEVNGTGSVSLTPDGLVASGEIRAMIRQQFAESFKDPLLVFRTRNDTERLLASAPQATETITRLLMGGSPKDEPLLANTFFAELNPQESVTFFSGVLARLYLIENAFLIREQVTDEHDGIAVFEEHGWLRSLSEHRKPSNALFFSAHLQRAAENMFWQRKWFDQKQRIFASHLIVERPALRISKAPSLFITALPLILDSIGAFVDSAVLREEEAGENRLPNRIFKDFVSKPFERTVCEELRKAGFLAGEVSEDGLWRLPNTNVRILHKQGESCPGEIDVLAVHPAHSIVWVIECKVIAYPIQLNRFRNISAKLGATDAEEFHSNLARKIDWIRSCDAQSMNLKNAQGILMLDRKLPWKRGGERSEVIDFESFLARLKGLATNNMQ